MKKSLCIFWAILIFLGPALAGTPENEGELPDTSQFLPTIGEIRSLGGAFWKVGEKTVNEIGAGGSMISSDVVFLWSKKWELDVRDDIKALTAAIYFLKNEAEADGFFREVVEGYSQKTPYPGADATFVDTGEMSDDVLEIYTKVGNYVIGTYGRPSRMVRRIHAIMVNRVVNARQIVVIEKNPFLKGKSFIGLAADGKSSLILTFNTPGSKKIEITSLPAGKLVAEKVPGLEKGAEIKANQSIFLDEKGKATVKYTPPDYLEGKMLTERFTIKKKHYGKRKIWAMEVPISFSYSTDGKTKKTSKVKIYVVRPPVFLIHGFIGNLNTLAPLASYLNRRKFDYHIDEYYKADQSIQDQADLLWTFIFLEKQSYGKAGFKLSKVDIVAHSTGGLFARYYTSRFRQYDDDVRKIIMLGTPNHGVSSELIKSGARLMSRALDKHRKMALQLKSGSAFLAELNRGEAYGAHLRKGIQYANIIGQIKGKEDDGIISTASSRLNGVVEYIYPGKKHTPNLSMTPGIGLTVARDVWDKIIELLLSDIPPGTN